MDSIMAPDYPALGGGGRSPTSAYYTVSCLSFTVIIGTFRHVPRACGHILYSPPPRHSPCSHCLEHSGVQHTLPLNQRLIKSGLHPQNNLRTSCLASFPCPLYEWEVGKMRQLRMLPAFALYYEICGILRCTGLVGSVHQLTLIHSPGLDLLSPSYLASVNAATFICQD